MGKGRPGPAPQTAKREQFAALIGRGVNYSEACRIVGINRRTGKRWRHGRTITSSSGRRLHYPPVVGVGRREISPRYLWRTSVSSSGIGTVPAHRCGRLPGSWAAAPPRSAGSFAATPTRTVAGTAHSPRNGRPPSGEPDRARASWPPIPSCASSFSIDSSSGGVPNRSLPRCATSSPTSRTAMWCRKPSIRRSTDPAWAGYGAMSCPGYCVLAGYAASRTATPTPAVPDAW